MDVHGIHTHLHGAAQTCGTEGEVVGKAELNLLVIVFDGKQLGPLCLGQLVGGEPTVVVVEIIGHGIDFLSVNLETVGTRDADA